ncbi:MAG: hypothetical protein JWN27_2879 [Candidatus Eremiobacteraeota bacterium]|nr:hypothetical protein [Candidatus Eremiobacteraeota bacterium]
MIAESLIAHLIGDYILQTDAMATRKTKQTLWALAHVITYGLPFLFLRPSWAALAVIVGTHFFIDRFRLARYVVAAKNSITDPANARRFFSSQTGYLEDVLESVLASDGATVIGCRTVAFGTPPWMAVWLLIIADNTLHVAINAAALTWLR